MTASVLVMMMVMMMVVMTTPVGSWLPTRPSAGGGNTTLALDRGGQGS